MAFLDHRILTWIFSFLLFYKFSSLIVTSIAFAQYNNLPNKNVSDCAAQNEYSIIYQTNEIYAFIIAIDIISLLTIFCSTVRFYKSHRDLISRDPLNDEIVITYTSCSIMLFVIWTMLVTRVVLAYSNVFFSIIYSPGCTMFLFVIIHLLIDTAILYSAILFCIIYIISLIILFNCNRFCLFATLLCKPGIYYWCCNKRPIYYQESRQIFRQNYDEESIPIFRPIS